MRQDIIKPNRDLSEFIELVHDEAGGTVVSSDASVYGFDPNADGITNAAAMNEALADNAIVTITQPGTYLISSATLTGILGLSNRAIVSAPGVTIKAADGWRGYMLKCDNISNFIVDGGVWDGNRDNRTGTLGTYYSSDWVEFDMVFVGCTDIVVRNSRHINSRRRCIWFTGLKGGNTCKNVLVANCSFDTRKVAVQVIGPVKNVRLLNLDIATSEDDAIAILGNDWDSVQPLPGGDVANGGDVDDLTIENIRFSIDALGGYPLNGIKLISGGDGTNPYTMRNVTVRNIKGPVQQYGILTNPHVVDASTALHQHNYMLIDDVEVEITGASTAFYPISIIATDTASMTILQNIRQRTAASGLIYLGSTAPGVLDRVDMRGIHGLPASAQALVRVGQGTLNYLSMSNCSANLTASSMVDVVAATVKRLQMNHCNLVTGNISAIMVSFRTTAGGCITEINNSHAENVRNVIAYQGTAVATHYLSLSNFTHETSVNISSPFTALISASGSAVQTITVKSANFMPVKGSGLNATSDPALRNLVLSGGAHVVRLTGTSLVVDGAVLGGPVEGDVINNSNAAFGTGVGTYLYTGAAWAKQ